LKARQSSRQFVAVIHQWRLFIFEHPYYNVYMIHDVDAIYDQGVFRPLEPLVLPEGTRVHLRIEQEKHDGSVALLGARVYSPRLAHPVQAADFEMEVREVPDAGL
jgi:predicted DNA-binding antitoxin AbrB/MazE fold protein